MGLTDEITVRLGLDETALGRGLAASKEKIVEFGRSTREGFNDIVKELAVPLSGAGILAGIEKVFGKVETIERTAAATGLAAESFQRFSYAAKQVGVESDAVEKSLSFLTKTLGEAGGTGPEAKAAAEKFAEFGISVRDASGHIRGTEEVMDEISKKMEAMTDPAQKAEMAMELFGKSGTKLISILGDWRQRSAGAAIFSDKDIENIKMAHEQIEGVTNTLMVWLGKGISGIGNAAASLGSTSIQKERGQAERDADTVATLKRIAEMKKATKERMDFEEASRKKIEDQLHRIAVRHREDDAEEEAKAQKTLLDQLAKIAQRHRDDDARERREEISREYLMRRQEETKLATESKKNQNYYSTIHELAQNPSWGWAYQTSRDIEARERNLKQYVSQYGARDTYGKNFTEYRDYTAKLKDQLEAAGYIPLDQTMEKMNDHLALISDRLNLPNGLPVDPVEH